MKRLKKALKLCIIFFLISRAFCAFADDPATLYGKATALEKSGDYGQAVEVVRQLVFLAPENDFYLAYTSHVERLAGDFENGLKHALSAVRINPGVPWYYVSVALNAYGAGDYQSAKKYGMNVVEMGADKVGQANYDNIKAMLRNLSDRNYVITWNLNPEKGYMKNGYYYIPAPTSGLPYQKADFRLTGAKEQKTVKENGNDIIYFRPFPGRPVHLTADVSIKAYSYKGMLAGYSENGEIPEDAGVYLGSSEGIDPESPLIINISGKIRADGKIDTIRNIMLWMKKNIRYQIEDFKTVDEIIQRGHAECGGWSALFVALCRGAGIPARGVWGVIEDPTPDRQFAPEGHLKGHAWAEFYLPGAGWIPIEPQSFETLGSLPSTYVRMYHYDMKSCHWTAENFRASDNMVVMGGDTPQRVESICR